MSIVHAANGSQWPAVPYAARTHTMLFGSTLALLLLVSDVNLLLTEVK